MFTCLGLPMNHYTISFFLQKNQTLSLALPTSNSSYYCTSDPVILGPRLYSRIDTARHLVRSDFFLQRLTQNFEIRRRVPRVKKKQTDEIQKEQTHISLSVDPPMQCLPWRACTSRSLSPSLSLHLQTRFGSRSDTNGIEDRMFHQFKNVCMR